MLRPHLSSFDYGSVKNGIRQALESMKLSDEEITELQTSEESKQVLFVFDGFDELANRDRVEDFPSYLGLNEWPNAKLVITCRPTAVSSHVDRDRVFGVHKYESLFAILTSC